MQHQLYWITKKTVQRKLGSKEDEHIISSDADLDAKIEVFKSISETSYELGKIIDQYQERLCILSQEECVFGRFLKEVGKRSKTTGQSILNTGKAISYSGQQRMCVRVPLLRLQHEVEVFRCRAVRDTYVTLQSMEKERTEYRAALSWMKSASTELDPDTGKGLDKFRNAQTHVRAAKQQFDSLSMDCVQKIDLLAAARCNMYSHALITYMTELQQFADKTASTFEIIANALVQKPKYDFCVLKDLTQDEGGVNEENINEKIANISTVDKDQSLFFSEDYADDENSVKKENNLGSNEEKNLLNDGNIEKILIELTQLDDEDHMTPLAATNTVNAGETPTNFFANMLIDEQIPSPSAAAATASASLMASEENRQITREKYMDKIINNKHNSTKSVKSNAWMDLFADLDPLANAEAFDLKLSGGRINSQQI